jgi:hypothetical protein
MTQARTGRVLPAADRDDDGVAGHWLLARSVPD